MRKAAIVIISILLFCTFSTRENRALGNFNRVSGNLSSSAISPSNGRANFETFIASNAPDEKDSLVRLLDAKSAQLKEIGNTSYRIVSGPARFLHNNTYLLCDSAIWNVNTNVIDAIGHVQIIQQDTYLVGDKLTYYTDDNLAQFRGIIVKLYNKKGDQLKTRFLDYNTRDSIAYFYNGGAMRSKDGQIIEGQNGRYESENRIFSFENDVQIFNDSIFIKASSAEYHSNEEKAYFHDRITAWKERDTLYSEDADFQRSIGLLTLKEDNYIATQDQEVWGDIIKYYRESGNAEMLNNVQIRDQEQSSILLGDKGLYFRSPMKAILTDRPVIATFSEEQKTKQEKDSMGVVSEKTEIVRDTMFTIGDTIMMTQIPMYEVSESEIKNAAQRKELAALDPMIEINEKNQEYLAAYYRNKEQIGKPQPLQNLVQKSNLNEQNNLSSDSLVQDGDDKRLNEDASAASDSSKSAVDSLANGADSADTFKNSVANSGSENNDSPLGKKTVKSPKDLLNKQLQGGEKTTQSKDTLAGGSTLSSHSASDSLSVDGSNSDVNSEDLQEPKDTTKITFLTIYNNVRMYRSNLAGKCDSLIYTSLDSIARFYKDPVLLNDQTNQFTADSMSLTIKNNEIFKANLIENAMIIVEEDSIHFNQIKSSEMVAYFADNDVYRFDALGGVQAMLFFRERDEAVTLMNQKSCKLLTAKIKDNEIQRVRYIDDIKSDMIPTYKLPIDQQRLRGFNWRKEELPKDRFELTDRVVKPSERGRVANISFPSYPQTKIYFSDSYKNICDLRDTINSRIKREDLERARKQEEERLRKEKEREIKRLRDLDPFEDQMVQQYVKDSLSTLISRCEWVLKAAYMKDKLIETRRDIPGYEGFDVQEYEYETQTDSHTNSKKKGRVLLLMPDAERLAYWTISACFKSVGSLDYQYTNKLLTHIRNQSGGQFPVKGVVYEAMYEPNYFEPYIFKDGVTVYISDSTMVASDAVDKECTPEMLDYYISLDDSQLKPYTGRFARIASTSREMYYEYGGKENVGAKPKEGVTQEDIPVEEARPLSYLKVVRELYKKAMRSSDNELIDAWCYSNLRKDSDTPH